MADRLVGKADSTPLPTISVTPESIRDRDEVIKFIATNLLDPSPMTLIYRPMKEPARNAMDNVHAAITPPKVVEDETVRIRQVPCGITVLVVTKVFDRHALSSIEYLAQNRGAGRTDSVKSNFSFWLQADIQSPEIDFRFAPESRHSRSRH